MSSLDVIITIVICLNLVFVMSQTGINNMSPNNVYINCSNTILSLGGCSGSINSNSAFNSSGLPTANVNSNNGFTDIFNTISNFFKTGFGGKILGYVFALYPLLNSTGCPIEYVIFIGSAWYIFSFWAVIEWWRGIG